MTAQEILLSAAERVEQTGIDAVFAIVVVPPLRILEAHEPGCDIEGAYDLLHLEIGHGPPLKPWLDHTPLHEQATALRNASLR